MRNDPAASHVVLVNGQQFDPHVSEVQSWTAPKLCPISWATTCHSVRLFVATEVPDTVPWDPWSLACLTQSCPSQATPTSCPVGQPDMSAHRPAWSFARWAPRHLLNADSRSLSVNVSQPVFHATD